jgi:hypothetical protein
MNLVLGREPEESGRGTPPLPPDKERTGACGPLGYAGAEMRRRAYPSSYQTAAVFRPTILPAEQRSAPICRPRPRFRVFKPAFRESVGPGPLESPRPALKAGEAESESAVLENEPAGNDLLDMHGLNF